MNRRHFLRSGSPQAAAQLGAGPLLALATPAPAAGEVSLVRFSRRAMATTFEIAVPPGTPDAWHAADAAFDLIDAVEDQLTIYRPDSEVVRLNESAAAAPVAVSAELFALLARAAALTRETRGCFDLAVGAVIAAWGLHRREGRVPPGAELAAARAASRMRHVVLNEANGTVKFLRPGLSLNFGALGKGYALDLAADVLRRWGVRTALLQAGGSSVRALGSLDGRGWPVALRHPTDPAQTLGVLRLIDQALGTSAATFQHFVVAGKRYGHLIDPRTGAPAEGMACASVVAPTAALADALSTAFFVGGVELARDICRAKPELAAVLLADAADGGSSLMPELLGVPAGRFEPAAARIQWPDDWPDV